MRASIIIAAHQEGHLLGKTVESCLRHSSDLEREIIVADDASTDSSVAEIAARFPEVQVVRHEERLGPSPTKDLGARRATGDVLIFLDAHTNPEPGAILRLVEDVERLDGAAIVTPAITNLCPRTWRNLANGTGHGYSFELETFSSGWLALDKLRKVERAGRSFYESPAAIGCALAVARELYDRLWGFDAAMRLWGVEDLDFSLKCWLMGHAILHDPEAVIGHRFQEKFSTYQVSAERVLVSQLRMAYKNLSPSTWREWLRMCRHRLAEADGDRPEGVFASAWHQFHLDYTSVELERVYLAARRMHDDRWYAERFDLSWPRMATFPLASLPLTLHPFTDPNPTPTPKPCDCTIQRKTDGEADYVDIGDSNNKLLVAQLVDLKLSCNNGTPSAIVWSLDPTTFKDYVVVDGPPSWSATLSQLTPGRTPNNRRSIAHLHASRRRGISSNRLRSGCPRIFCIRGGLGWRIACSLSLLIGHGITTGCRAKKEVAQAVQRKEVVQTAQKKEVVQTVQNIEPMEKNAMNATSTESKGLSLTLEIPARVRLGKPVDATITLKNGRSAYVQVLVKGRRHGDYGLLVFRADGVKCQHTEYGSHTLADIPDTRPGSAGARRIGPGEKSVWEVDLNKCFQLSEGRFTAIIELNVHPAGGGGVHLTVDSCAFDVVPAEHNSVLQE